VKRLLALVVAGLGALMLWRRLTARDEPAEEAPVSLPEEETARLGGEVDAELLAILACPVDKQPVSRAGNYLVCGECRRHYPIREGIPVMLVDEALTPEQAAAAPG
jgi:uncharacterized protein YbaR (Trm112 family)